MAWSRRRRKWTRAWSRQQHNRQPFPVSEVERLFSELDLPVEAREATEMLYRHVVEEQVLRGRDMQAVAAAAVYAACRQCGLPITLEEVAYSSRADKKAVGQALRWMSRQLSLEVRPATASLYLPRFCRLLDVGEEVQSTAEEILQRAERAGATTGRSPTGVAAAVIYIAAKLQDARVPQQDIGEVAGVTPVTIRNRYKELVDQLNIDL